MVALYWRLRSDFPYIKLCQPPWLPNSTKYLQTTPSSLFWLHNTLKFLITTNNLQMNHQKKTQTLKNIPLCFMCREKKYKSPCRPSSTLHSPTCQACPEGAKWLTTAWCFLWSHAHLLRTDPVWSFLHVGRALVLLPIAFCTVVLLWTHTAISHWMY